MSVEFRNSETKHNLIKAFAGESQAVSRYTFAASQARSENLAVIQSVFLFTAGQEKEHAEIFYKFLKEFSGEKISGDGSYPVDIYKSTLELLRASQNNEFDEYNHVYKDFAETAKKEGFVKISSTFDMISKIEKTHGNRFKHLADLLERQQLFISDVETKWMCLNCGEVYEGKSAPLSCPVCSHNQGFFVRLELAPFTDATGFSALSCANKRCVC
ncbi:MAG: rubrerythrin family protein [Oscillospiraceae bacterium]|jgi:rubrerythrin|nr:rubrerythrin family protein [Oscillospiraceae bacterium]